jgi:hypothetical protein
MTGTLAWRGCAGCDGTLLLDEEQQGGAATLDAAGAYLLCRTCRAREEAREAAVTVRRNTSCVHAALQSGPFSDLYVLAVDGDLVTVGALGFNGIEDPARVAEIEGRWWPPQMRGRRQFRRSELRMKGI